MKGFELQIMLLNISITLVILIIIGALIGTIALGGKNDEAYDADTKGNITRLTLIYVALTVVLIVGIGMYLYLY